MTSNPTLFQTWNDWSDATRMADWFASKAEIERLTAELASETQARERLLAELNHARAEARAMHSAYETSVKLRAADETIGEQK